MSTRFRFWTGPLQASKPIIVQKMIPIPPEPTNPGQLLQGRIRHSSSYQISARSLHGIPRTCATFLINTVALARCQNMQWTSQLFQQFAILRGKPLKRLGGAPAPWHRAKAAVLMRTCGSETCEVVEPDRGHPFQRFIFFNAFNAFHATQP